MSGTPKPWRGLTEEDAQIGARLRITANGWVNNEAIEYWKEIWTGSNEETGTTKQDGMLANQGVMMALDW